MKKSIVVQFSPTDSILFEESSRARGVHITVRPFQGVRVAVPYGCSFKRAEEFVRQKRGWILRHLEIVKRMERESRSVVENLTVMDKAEAKRILMLKIEELSARHGFIYNKVFIRSQRTRWGSCSEDNNISLNIKLSRLSEDLVDYVILHELVHTRIKNHSKNFWAELGKYVSNARAVSLRLKRYPLAML